jgi:hypothetical protein
MARTPEHFYILRGAWRRFESRAPLDDDPYSDDLSDGDEYGYDDDLYLAPDDDEYDYEYEYAASPPLWTRRQRVLLTLLVIIMLLSLLVYTFQGFFVPPPPPPTIAPGSLI